MLIDTFQEDGAPIRERCGVFWTSPVLQRQPDEPFAVPHDHHVDPGGGGQGLLSAPYRDRQGDAFTALGKYVSQTGSAHGKQAWSKRNKGQKSCIAAMLSVVCSLGSLGRYIYPVLFRAVAKRLTVFASHSP